MRTKVVQPGVGRQPIENQIFGCARQHGLPPMGQIAQPRGPVDGRADVVALVTQLHHPGMHADAQPESGPAVPSATPGRTPPRCWLRVNATTKLSPSPCSTRPHTMMGGDDLTHRAIDRAARWRPSSPPVGSATAASSPRRRPAATSPFPSEARSHPGRSSSKPCPARGSVPLMLSRHAATRYRKHQRNRVGARPAERTYDTSPRRFTRPDRTDDLAPAASDSRLVPIRGSHHDHPYQPLQRPRRHRQQRS